MKPGETLSEMAERVGVAVYWRCLLAQHTTHVPGASRSATLETPEANSESKDRS